MKSLSILAICFALTTPAFADSHETGDAEAHVKKHEQMAEMHKEAADCIRDGKSVEDCDKAMKSAMKDMHDCCAADGKCKDGQCPMKKKGKGKHRAHKTKS